MLGVGGRGAVATAEDFVTVKQGVNQGHGRTGDRIRQGFRRRNLGLNTFRKADFNSFEHGDPYNVS